MYDEVSIRSHSGLRRQCFLRHVIEHRKARNRLSFCRKIPISYIIYIVTPETTDQYVSKPFKVLCNKKTLPGPTHSVPGSPHMLQSISAAADGFIHPTAGLRGWRKGTATRRGVATVGPLSWGAGLASEQIAKIDSSSQWTPNAGQTTWIEANHLHLDTSSCFVLQQFERLRDMGVTSPHSACSSLAPTAPSAKMGSWKLGQRGPTATSTCTTEQHNWGMLMVLNSLALF